MKKTIPLLLLVNTLCVTNLFSNDTSIGKNLKIDAKVETHQTHEAVSWWYKSPDNLATVVGSLISAIIGSSVVIYLGLKTYNQWQRDQKWKRKEVILDRISTLDITPGTQNAFLMLNSNDRDIALWDHSQSEQRYVRVKREKVCLALLPGSLLPYVYSAEESAIRDSFADLLGRLSQAGVFIREKLVSKEDMGILMEPLICAISCLNESDKPVDKMFIRNFHAYISYRGFHSAKSLLEDFNVGSKEKIEDVMRILKQEVDEGKWIRREGQRPVFDRN